MFQMIPWSIWIFTSSLIILDTLTDRAAAVSSSRRMDMNVSGTTGDFPSSREQCI